MARIKIERLKPEEVRAVHRELVYAIKVLRQQDVWPFLRDLLTPVERVMLGRRIRIAKALLAGDSYDLIAAKQKASFTTIRHVHLVLEKNLRGYRDVLPRALALAERNARAKRQSRRRNDLQELVRHMPGLGRSRYWLDLLTGVMGGKDDEEEK